MWLNECQKHLLEFKLIEDLNEEKTLEIQKNTPMKKIMNGSTKQKC